jgi:hypothetical protein
MVTFLRRRPTPVEGSVIRASSRKVMVHCGVGVGVLCFLLLLVWGLFSLGWAELKSTAIQLIVVIVVALGFAPFCLLAFWKSRVVIGGDRLQVVRGGARVVVQIPYRNLSRTATRRNFVGFRVLGIDVDDRNDPHTCWGFLNCGNQQFPFDVVIYNMYAESPEAIGEQVVGMQRRWRSEELSRTGR